MSKLKRVSVVLLVLGLVFGSFALSGSLSVKAQENPTVGLVTINLQARFFNRINAGAKDAAEEHGVNLEIIDGRDEPQRQVNGVENLIAQNVDAIIIIAIDVEGIKPVLRDARDEGIPVIAVDAEVSMPPANAFIGVDNYGAGLKAGAFTVGYLHGQGMATGDETVEIGILGALNSYIQNLRKDAFVSMFNDAPNIEIVQTVDGQNNQEVALSAGENLVTANPNLDVIYATGEPALIGAISAVQSQNKTDEVEIIGWDLSPQGIQAVESGLAPAVIQQHPYQEGVEAINKAVKLINGEEVEKTTLIPVTIATENNVDRFKEVYGG